MQLGLLDATRLTMSRYVDIVDVLVATGGINLHG
jgi:hypothetical protein